MTGPAKHFPTARMINAFAEQGMRRQWMVQLIEIRNLPARRPR